MSAVISELDSELSPGFLVASPSLQCPFFHHTVVLMLDHSDEGSFGFVINKPSTIDFPRILEELELEGPGAAPLVLQGGPVSPESGWVVYDPRTAPKLPAEQTPVTHELSVTASLEMIQLIAEGDGPTRSVMLLGYSGWGPGQLEEEMKSGSWIPVDADPRLVFDADIETRWETALRAAGIDPARVVTRDLARA